jgi:hypothetical protein
MGANKAGRRAGNHRGRKGKNGVYSPKHNDRNTKEQPEHINPDKIADNKIVLYGREQADITIDAHEQNVYEELLSTAIEKHNAKQVKNRHKDLCMDMEQARKNEKWCPEETVFTLSNADNPIDPALLWSVHQDYINWHLQQYPQCRLLDSAMHVDEANPHIHDRWLWLAQETDADGNQYNIVNQSRALEQMGVERPDLSKKTGRRNNAKMTYTADCRQHQIAFARAHGLDIIDEPQDPSLTGLSHEKYILNQIQADQQAVQATLEQARQQALKLQPPPKGIMESKAAYEKRVQQWQHDAAVGQVQTEVDAKLQEIAEKSAHLEQDRANLKKIALNQARGMYAKTKTNDKLQIALADGMAQKTGELLHSFTGEIPTGQRIADRQRDELARGISPEILQRRIAIQDRENAENAREREKRKKNSRTEKKIDIDR